MAGGPGIRTVLEGISLWPTIFTIQALYILGHNNRFGTNTIVMTEAKDKSLFRAATHSSEPRI